VPVTAGLSRKLASEVCKRCDDGCLTQRAWEGEPESLSGFSIPSLSESIVTTVHFATAYQLCLIPAAAAATKPERRTAASEACQQPRRRRGPGDN
jgi:hypothetical protein